jgi:hypothetical protein
MIRTDSNHRNVLPLPRRRMAPIGAACLRGLLAAPQ